MNNYAELREAAEAVKPGDGDAMLAYRMASGPEVIRALLAERDALRDALEMMVEMVEMNGWGRDYAMDVARAALAQEQVKNDTTLFCDLKTDEEKSAFFLSGRGYETGVIAQAIQNDVAMAYHRCVEYKKELEALQSQDADRLDWLQQSDGRFFKLLHITSIVGRGFSPTNSNGKWFPSLRDAIDHARRIEGDGE